MNLYAKKPKWQNYKAFSIKYKENFFRPKNLISLAILIFFILFSNIFQNQIRNYFHFILSPVTKIFLSEGNKTSIFFSSFLNAQNLKKENDNLKQDNQKLISEITLLKEEFVKNQAVKEVIENTKEYDHKIIPVKVVGLYLFDDFIVIDGGSDDGIFESMPVISSQRVLYGVVTKVYKSFSQVMLISNKKSVLNIKIQGDILNIKPVYGIIRGGGSLSLNLDLVNYDAPIKDGDIIVTSGLEGTFPIDLLVGKIKSVNKDDLKAFQEAKVQPFFSLKNIDNVFVITNYLRI